jgi:hypothetical protein
MKLCPICMEIFRPDAPQAKFCSQACKSSAQVGQGKPRGTEEERIAKFWRKVQKTEGCWLWTKNRCKQGYGQVFWAGRQAKAHRVAYELTKGPVPAGLELDHLCRNRACVRPDHLDPVTHRVNVLRGEGVAARRARRTHCPQGHPYDEKNTYRFGRQRMCRACHLVHTRAHKARTKAAQEVRS